MSLDLFDCNLNITLILDICGIFQEGDKSSKHQKFVVYNVCFLNIHDQPLKKVNS